MGNKPRDQRERKPSTCSKQHHHSHNQNSIMCTREVNLQSMGFISVTIENEQHKRKTSFKPTTCIRQHQHSPNQLQYDGKRGTRYSTHPRANMKVGQKNGIFFMRIQVSRHPYLWRAWDHETNHTLVDIRYIFAAFKCLLARTGVVKQESGIYFSVYEPATLGCAHWPSRVG